MFYFIIQFSVSQSHVNIIAGNSSCEHSYSCSFHPTALGTWFPCDEIALFFWPISKYMWNITSFVQATMHCCSCDSVSFLNLCLSLQWKPRYWHPGADNVNYVKIIYYNLALILLLNFVGFIISNEDLSRFSWHSWCASSGDCLQVIKDVHV